MKRFLFVILMAYPAITLAQSSAEAEVKQDVLSFFEAFHLQDTTALKSMAKGDIIMQSIGTDTEGQTVLNQNSYSKFVRSIGGIPKETEFEERLLDFRIQVDGRMANAWTPYEFWYNGQLSHCGVNSFQLIKESDGWKIIYLVDTRRREGCK
jgi:hypothetical protein